MNTEFDVNEQYENLFGSYTPINLFDTDEEYELLRQEIIMSDQPRVNKYRKPFENFRVASYQEVALLKNIEKSRNNAYRVFFIKRGEYGEYGFCNAAGFYNHSNSIFVILAYSYIIAENRFLVNENDLLRARTSTLMKKSQPEGRNNRFLTQNIFCNSPKLAAAYVLGCNADATEWVNDKGKNILEIYPQLKATPIVERRQEDLIIPHSPTRLATVQSKQNAMPSTPSVIEQGHEFFIHKGGICRATGVYDPETTHFYILKDSLVAEKEDKGYVDSPSWKARQRFLEMACTPYGNYYKVTRNTKCKSASAAASYVLGRATSYTAWQDSQGKDLHAFWPDKFTMPCRKGKPFEELRANLFDALPSSEKKSSDTRQIFYIVREKEHGRKCNASGYYDSTSQNFILQEGSLLALEPTLAYMSTTYNMMRMQFLDKYCKKEKEGYRLKRDQILSSPSQAASFVLGRTANGWTEWKDKENNPLGSIDVNFTI